MENKPAPHVEADVTVKWDVWKVAERLGFATLILILAGMHFFRQDAAKQTYIQDESAKNATAIKEQAKLDREREKMQAQFIQSKLIEVVESQVAATVAATKATESATEVNERSAAAQVKVAESLDSFVDTAGNLVERVDKLVEKVEEPKP